MPIFAVLTKIPRPAVVSALQRLYPDHVEVSDTIRFIRAQESAKAISDKLFAATDTHNGVIVTRVSADYFGYAKSEIWDWLAKSFREESNG